MTTPIILCAVDGRPNSDRALAHAAEAAVECGAELHVVHIADAPAAAGMLGGEQIAWTPGARRARVQDAVAELIRDGRVAVHTHLLADGFGSPAARIALLADTLGADLIVVGSRGRSALGGALTGSVAQNLARHTLRPIVTVPGARAQPKESTRRWRRRGHRELRNPSPRRDSLPADRIGR